MHEDLFTGNSQVRGCAASMEIYLNDQSVILPSIAGIKGAL
jgi:hypothetical protein